MRLRGQSVGKRLVVGNLRRGQQGKSAGKSWWTLVDNSRTYEG